MVKRVLIAALIAARPLAAQQDDTLYVRNNFVKREAIAREVAEREVREDVERRQLESAGKDGTRD